MKKAVPIALAGLMVLTLGPGPVFPKDALKEASKGSMAEKSKGTPAEPVVQTVYYDEKDPFVAGLLSATMLGLGQFYVKQYTKGSIFVLLDLVQKGMLIWMVSALNERYTARDGSDSIVEWKELTDGDQALVLGFVAFYFGTRLYSIVDAMSGAADYNRQSRLRASLPDLNYHVGRDTVAVSWNRKF